MALLVTLFLVLVNIFNSVTGQAPKSEGLTAVETWVVMCILHVFCVLLEYAVILKIIQNEKRRIVAFRRAMAQQHFYAAAQIPGANQAGQHPQFFLNSFCPYEYAFRKKKTIEKRLSTSFVDF